ncbi:MAG: PilZ domain-containing protein [Planctomycetes bacterium]|nr:PilZ domain-containing protein [Planctomycetota bacterium]
MDIEEIVRLTRQQVAAVIEARQKTALGETEHPVAHERRRHTRWPFKGAVEIWPENGDGRIVTHGTCLNIGETGLGLSCDEHLQPGSTVEIAVHLPEATLCGKAIVRYCAEVRNQFMVGMEFVF